MHHYVYTDCLDGRTDAVARHVSFARITCPEWRPSRAKIRRGPDWRVSEKSADLYKNFAHISSTSLETTFMFTITLANVVGLIINAEEKEVIVIW